MNVGNRHGNVHTVIDLVETAKGVRKSLPEKIPVMGVHITPFASYDDACQGIGALIATRQKAFSVAINPEKIYQAQRDETLCRLLNEAQIGICDGIGAALAVRLLRGISIPRITGISLFYALVRAAEQSSWKIFLLGASPESNQGAEQNLLATHPNLKIVGRRDGYFQDSAEVVEQINASGADIVFVAMGSPKQELWIHENRADIEAPFCMGVGGTFDVVSGKVKWAPPVFRKSGTEWLYRLICEPKRWRRQMVLPKFAMKVCFEKMMGQG